MTAGSLKPDAHVTVCDNPLIKRTVKTGVTRPTGKTCRGLLDQLPSAHDGPRLGLRPPHLLRGSSQRARALRLRDAGHVRRADSQHVSKPRKQKIYELTRTKQERNRESRSTARHKERDAASAGELYWRNVAVGRDSTDSRKPRPPNTNASGRSTRTARHG